VGNEIEVSSALSLAYVTAVYMMNL